MDIIINVFRKQVIIKLTKILINENKIKKDKHHSLIENKLLRKKIFKIIMEKQKIQKEIFSIYNVK